MAEIVTIAAQKRDFKGSRASRRLRTTGKIPGILYGHGEEPVSLILDTIELKMAVRHGAHGLLELDIEGKKESVVIKDLQYDHLGDHYFHVDFARVSADERVTTSVPIHLKGSLEGTKTGGVLEQPLHEIEIECLASNLVEHLVVNIRDLTLGQAVTVADLVLPEGAKALADPDEIVVHIVKAAGESAEEEGLGEGASSEPEVIRREKSESEDEE